jgi:uncharacterized UPF0160 family protein
MEEQFKGKRSIRYSNAGNINGYIGRRFYCYIGERYFSMDEDKAADWVAGRIDL